MIKKGLKKVMSIYRCKMQKKTRALLTLSWIILTIFDRLIISTFFVSLLINSAFSRPFSLFCNSRYYFFPPPYNILFIHFFSNHLVSIILTYFPITLLLLSVRFYFHTSVFAKSITCFNIFPSLWRYTEMKKIAFPSLSTRNTRDSVKSVLAHALSCPLDVCLLIRKAKSLSLGI